MRERPPIYGLDIETDTTVDGLDPAVAPVMAVALSTPAGDEVFDGAEHDLLQAVDERLARLAPGIIATWNGAAFDMPFLADRARCHGVDLALAVLVDARIPLRHRPLQGHRGAYRASWHAHRHLDCYRLYRSDVGPALRVSCSLKAIARLVGLAPLEVDREHIHDLDRSALRAYVASDARLARVLAERRWPGAHPFVDSTVTGRR